MTKTDSILLDRHIIALKALEILQEIPWSDLKMITLANALNIQGSYLYRHISDKNDLLKSIIQLIDDRTWNAYQTSLQGFQDLSPLDQLFEAIMCRLEIISPHKRAFEHLKSAFWPESPCSFDVLPQIFASSRKMLKMSSISIEGILGMIKVKAFAILYVIILKEWLKQKETDPSDMMIEIDHLLKQIAPLLI